MDKLTAREIKHLQSLRLKKFRQKYGQFIVEGEKLVDELLHSSYKLVYLMATPAFFHHPLVVQNADLTKTVSDIEIKKLSALVTPPGLMALVEIPVDIHENNTVAITSAICLESIKDPGNLGTIIRIADWYGLDKVYCSQDCVDVYNPKTISSTMGSLFRIKVIYTDLVALITHSKIDSLAFTIDGKAMQENTLPKNALLIIGSESHGISESIQNLCTQKLSIKRIGKAESLNAAIATAIACDRIFNV
jgi:RNA methyltransferase, TrmH family